MRLLRDRRTAAAYESAQARNLADPQLGIPDPFGPPADQLLKKLARSEQVQWLSWACELRDGPASWWVLALTSERLIGVSPTPPPQVWTVPLNLWRATPLDGDVVLDIAGGAPLRVRGAGHSVELFRAPAAPKRSTRTSRSKEAKNRVLRTADTTRPTTAAAPGPRGPRANDAALPSVRASSPMPAPAGRRSSADDVLDRGDVGHAHLEDAAAEQSPAGAERAVVSTWQEAEALAAWHMKKLGFAGVELTGAGADRGIDVTSDDAAAQVKHYAKGPIGAPAVQQLRGAATGREWALFYSWSGYTKSAQEFAETANVALFKYEQSGEIRSVNSAAEHLVDRAGVEAVPSISEFELEREAKQSAQKYFDMCFSIFSSVMRQALAEAESNSQVHLAGKVELARVQTIVADVGSRTVPLNEFMDQVERINEATRRLAADLGIDPGI